MSGRQIAAILDRIFGEFEYVEDAFIRHSPGRSRHLAMPLKFVPLLRQLFRFAHSRVIFGAQAALKGSVKDWPTPTRRSGAAGAFDSFTPN